MKESNAAKGRRILNAMLKGRKITPAEANRIGRTTEENISDGCSS